MAASNSETARRSPLRQQFGERLCQLWRPEYLDANDPVVVHVNQHVTGILEPAAYTTLTWPGSRLRRRVDSGAVLGAAPAPVINPKIVNLVSQRGLLTPEQHATSFGGKSRERTAQLELRRAVAGWPRLCRAFVAEKAAKEILGTLVHIHSNA